MHQPVYAEHGIATFPLTDNKRPAIRNYQKIGLRSSAGFAARFTDSDSFGFMTNRAVAISVLDVDTNDERVLADAIVPAWADAADWENRKRQIPCALQAQWRVSQDQAVWRPADRSARNWRPCRCGAV